MDDQGRFAQPVSKTNSDIIPDSEARFIRPQKQNKKYHSFLGPKSQKLGFFVCLGALGGVFFYGLMQGGHLDAPNGEKFKFTQFLGAIAGLKVRQVEVSGSNHLNAETVLKALKVKRYGSMLAFDAEAARMRLEKIDRIEKAQVMKLFPGRVLVKITERQPFALWQYQGVYKVIDPKGHVLNGLNVANHAHLPIIVGQGAGKSAKHILMLLTKFPSLKARMHALVRVGNRRWNLKLANGLTVLLPEQKPQLALAELIKLNKKYQILSKNLALVDFRLPDRITLSPNSAKTAKRI